MGFARDNLRAATRPIIVGQEYQTFYAGWDRNPAEPLIAKSGPDGDAEQDHGGERGFNAFRQAKDVGGIGQHDGAACRTPQHATGIFKVPCPAREHRVQEGPLDGYHASALLNGGEHCGAKDDLAPWPERRARVKAERWRDMADRTVQQISRDRRVRDGARVVPKVSGTRSQPALISGWRWKDSGRRPA
jgi:hypothetical protein